MLGSRRNVLISGRHRLRARRRCSALWSRCSRPRAASSPSRTPWSCGCAAPTACGFEARGLASRDVTIRDLVRHALRHRPDHIVVGEVRGAEAADLLQALNTGHGGSLATVHANNAEAALSRLATLRHAGGRCAPVGRRLPRGRRRHRGRHSPDPNARRNPPRRPDGPCPRLRRGGQPLDRRADLATAAGAGRTGRAGRNGVAGPPRSEAAEAKAATLNTTGSTYEQEST